MKNFSRNLLLGCASIFFFTACEKDESQKTGSVISAADEPYPPITYVPAELRVWPLSPLKTSEQIAGKITGLPNPIVHNTAEVVLEAINNPGKSYLNATCTIDLKKFTDSLQYTDDKISMRFIQGFKLLKAGSTGWWSHWNYSPYVECERPDVLFENVDNGTSYQSANTMTIILSKKVKIFGFELATNKLNATYVGYVDYHSDESVDTFNSMGYVTQTVSSPSGARLFAVKSKKPFSKITINISYDYFTPPFGFAIANVRYQL